MEKRQEEHWRDWMNIGEETEGAQSSSKRNDMTNGIAMHTWKIEHKVHWEAATVKQVETHYTKRRIIPQSFSQFIFFQIFQFH